MSEGLRLMIYDKSDVKRTLKQLRLASKELDGVIDAVDEFLPGDFEQVDLDIPLGLSHAWLVGGHLYKFLGKHDVHKGFYTWAAALQWLATVKSDMKIKSIQYWGHGSPGKVWLGQEALMNHSLANGTMYSKAFMRVKERLTEDAVIWWRTCATFGGQEGKKFAESWSTGMNCTIAAHTYNIGLYQSGLHTCKPGEKPLWSDYEGLKKGRRAMSSRRDANTIFMLKSEIPNGW